MVFIFSVFFFSEKFVEAEPLSWRFWRKRRYIVVLLAFLGFFNVYSLRVNLSVAIVAMTENRTVIDENGNESWEQDFPWDPKQKGLILSSFFYGYILTQFIGGFIGAKIGGNVVSLNSCMTLVSCSEFNVFFLTGIWYWYWHNSHFDVIHTHGSKAQFGNVAGGAHYRRHF